MKLKVNKFYTNDVSDLCTKVIKILSNSQTHIEVMLGIFRKKGMWVYEYNAYYKLDKSLISDWKEYTPEREVVF